MLRRANDRHPCSTVPNSFPAPGCFVYDQYVGDALADQQAGHGQPTLSRADDQDIQHGTTVGACPFRHPVDLGMAQCVEVGTNAICKSLQALVSVRDRHDGAARWIDRCRSGVLPAHRHG